MRIAYLSTDEVNLDLARRWARKCGCKVVPLGPRHPLPNGDHEAAIYDLDFLPPVLRQQVLSRLLRGPRDGPIAVHSYNLGEQQVADLRSRGIHVWRRLERAIFLLLRRDALRLRAAAGPARDAIVSPPRAKYDPDPSDSSNTFLAG